MGKRKEKGKRKRKGHAIIEKGRERVGVKM